MSKTRCGMTLLLLAACSGTRHVAKSDTAAGTVDTLVGLASVGPQAVPPHAGPLTTADTATVEATGDELAVLARQMIIPVQGVIASQLRDSYTSARAGHVHEALDIMAARGTPVLSAVDGKLTKLHNSVAGGLMVYAADASDRFVLMYGHLDRYADGDAENMPLKRGQLIGYVGSTGNAIATAPHLHFAIARGHPSAAWWKGEAVNPFPLLTGAPMIAPADTTVRPTSAARAESSVAPKAVARIPDSVKVPTSAKLPGVTRMPPATVPATTKTVAVPSIGTPEPRLGKLSPAEARKLVSARATSAIEALAVHDLVKLAALADSAKGVRFSPYQHVDVKSDRVLGRGQLRAAWASRKISVWGTHDGSGAPMRLTYQEYHKAFVYDYDFAKAAKVEFNGAPLGRGNTPNNIAAVYPDAIVVEHHTPGIDPMMHGMDWKSLWLVFERRGATWYLVGVVHGAWTI